MTESRLKDNPFPLDIPPCRPLAELGTGSQHTGRMTSYLQTSLEFLQLTGLFVKNASSGN
jgi:hypothetical protein